MAHRRTTLSKFIIEDQVRRANADLELTALLNDIQTACKFIAAAVSRGALNASVPDGDTGDSQGLDPRILDVVANEIFMRECEWGGKLAAMASAKMTELYAIPAAYPRGQYLLVFDPLDGALNLDVNASVGTIFSVLRAPEGLERLGVEAFLQPGTAQLAAGFALYGPSSMIVLTLGAGVHAFTLEPEIGAYTLTRRNMRVAAQTREFAINPSNGRFWEPAVRHYVDECTKGAAGPRGADFTMRWVDSAVSEVFRILVRGGLVMYPRDAPDVAKPGSLSLLHEANPLAMLIEQAGGAASTGRQRILDIVPTSLQQRVPAILGSSDEVQRLCRYHETIDNGEALAFETPLFNARTLFRAAP